MNDLEKQDRKHACLTEALALTDLLSHCSVEDLDDDTVRNTAYRINALLCELKDLDQ